jgi:hypothetical protein
VTTERDLATAVGRQAVGTNAFQTGVRKQRSVDQLQRSGQAGGAIRAAWEAVDLFKQAQTEGRRLAQNEANTPKPPVVVAPPPPNPSAGRSTAPPTPRLRNQRQLSRRFRFRATAAGAGTRSA